MNFRVNLIDNDEPEDIDMRIKRLCNSLSLKVKIDISNNELWLYGTAAKNIIIGRFITKKALCSHLEVIAEYERFRKYLVL